MNKIVIISLLAAGALSGCTSQQEYDQSLQQNWAWRTECKKRTNDYAYCLRNNPYPITEPGLPRWAKGALGSMADNLPQRYNDTVRLPSGAAYDVRTTCIGGDCNTKVDKR